jgi:ubiquinone/menaquinone biosynthesis C-methylase UbiE
MKRAHGEAVERLDTEISKDALQVALHNQRYEFALARIGVEDSVLEVGTGTGCFSQRVLGRCKDFTGLEYDPGAYEITRRRLGGKGTLVRGDAHALPFERGSFSVIVCLEVLEHLENYRAAVSEMQRCLRGDGRVIVSVPYRKRGGPNPLNRFHVYEPGEVELVGTFRHSFSKVEVFYQFFEETRFMTFARVFHLRSVFGLDTVYRDLAEGTPLATAKLRIATKPSGFRINLLLIASGASSALQAHRNR